MLSGSLVQSAASRADTKTQRSPSIWCFPSPALLSIFHSSRKHALCFCSESKDVLENLGNPFLKKIFFHLFVVSELGEKLFLTLVASGSQEKEK